MTTLTRTLPRVTSTGWTTAEAVDLAAALFPVAEPRHPGGAAFVMVSPGSVQIRFDHGRTEWSEKQRAADDADREQWARQLQLELHDLDDDELGESTRGVITEWSRKSRANMVRCLAQRDWQPLAMQAGYRLAMVTLTYPGDWQKVAPTGESSKRHLDAFFKWLDRRGWGDGAWKLEFQSRGAPHYHLMLSLPIGKTAKYRLESGRDGSLGELISEAWARIVGAEGDERAKHRNAGTRIDFSHGARCSDPVRLATYFAKHGSPTVGSRKEYQHDVPCEWTLDGCGPGRFWGVRGVPRVVREVQIERRHALELLRIVKGWSRAQGRVYRQPRRRQVDKSTGEITWRRPVHRRWVIAHNAGGGSYGLTPSLSGRFVLVNDGPGFAAQLARACSPPAEHRRGDCRPLP